MKKYGQKGVVLFIVEGISDKLALGLLFSRLVCSDTVQFGIMHGDCLSRNTGRVIPAIQDCVKSMMQKYNYKRSDFVRIIHIIDTDGSFIPDNRVFMRSKKGVGYYSDRIEAGEYPETISRHHRRTAAALMLSTTEQIMKIPYSIYFMSRNLEHVTQGEAGQVESGHKVSFAERFADRFEDDPYGFMEMLYKENVAAKGDYQATWREIMQGTNSLKRRSNINLFLESYYNEIYSNNT